MSNRGRLLIGLMLGFFWLFNKTITQCNAERSYLGKLNLHLTGRIIDIDRVNGYNGFDIIKVKVLYTNKVYYDPRGKYENYYCIIKNGFAELYQDAINCSEGDTVDLNTDKMLFTIRKSSGNKDEVIQINDDKRYYEYLKNNHQNF
jgi:hypothetical protein